MIMPFGKHQGQEVSTVPAGYLCWILESFTDLDDDLREAIRHELVRRFELVHVTNYIMGLGPDELESIVSNWFRRLALKWHPDRGADHRAMQALNEPHHEIRKELRLQR
jgi:hypothetical protein